MGVCLSSSSCCCIEEECEYCGVSSRYYSSVEHRNRPSCRMNKKGGKKGYGSGYHRFI